MMVIHLKDKDVSVQMLNLRVELVNVCGQTFDLRGQTSNVCARTANVCPQTFAISGQTLTNFAETEMFLQQLSRFFVSNLWVKDNKTMLVFDSLKSVMLD